MKTVHHGGMQKVSGFVLESSVAVLETVLDLLATLNFSASDPKAFLTGSGFGPRLDGLGFLIKTSQESADNVLIL